MWLPVGTETLCQWAAKLRKKSKNKNCLVDGWLYAAIKKCALVCVWVFMATSKHFRLLRCYKNSLCLFGAVFVVVAAASAHTSKWLAIIATYIYILISAFTICEYPRGHMQKHHELRATHIKINEGTASRRKKGKRSEQKKNVFYVTHLGELLWRIHTEFSLMMI